MGKYIWEHSNWPNFHWSSEILIDKLATVRQQQGLLLGKMQTLGFELEAEASVEMLAVNVVASSAIEGVNLSDSWVRSSVASRLGLPVGGVPNTDKNIDGIVDLTVDAVQNWQGALTAERLCDWHSKLFPPTSKQGKTMVTGAWRTDAKGPMQVVSGAAGRERVHFVAPPAAQVNAEMQLFFNWFNGYSTLDPVLKSGVAHLWFLTIHPFADGNGRLGRAIADMLLARADRTSQRFYSMSSQIQKERKQYYSMLEQTQSGTLDITAWLVWYLECLAHALESSNDQLGYVVQKHFFWQHAQQKPLNMRQIKLINKMLDGFIGPLTTSKWAKIAKCSTDTALRDIQELVGFGLLQKGDGGGRSTHYYLAEFSAP